MVCDLNNYDIFQLTYTLVTGRKSNKWSPVTIRLALAIFSRSPSAYNAVKSLGILNLPCNKTLRGYMDQHFSTAGINDEALLEHATKYESFKDERVRDGFKKPVGEGVLIWDEVKVC